MNTLPGRDKYSFAGEMHVSGSSRVVCVELRNEVKDDVIESAAAVAFSGLVQLWLIASALFHSVI